jgi:hypothetical protein
VNFFMPGTNIAATTGAFGLILVDVEAAGSTHIDFFDQNNTLIFTRTALVGGNRGLSFLGGVADAGEQIARVRIISGINTIVSNGVLGNSNDDVVVMDDFLYAEPLAHATAPEPASLTLLGLGSLGLSPSTRKNEEVWPLPLFSSQDHHPARAEVYRAYNSC